MDSGLKGWRPLSEEETARVRKELDHFVEDFASMNETKQSAIRKLREAADYLEKVWRDCRIASAVGSSAGILGSVLTIGGGVATILTAGFAAPLVGAGIAIGIAGAGTKAGTAAVKTLLNSMQIKEAEEAIEVASLATQKVKEQVEVLKERKNLAHLLSLREIAITLYGPDNVVIRLLDHLLQSLGINMNSAPGTIQCALTMPSIAAIGDVWQMGENAVAKAMNRAASGNAGTKAAARAVGNAGTKTVAGTAGNVGAKAAAKATGNAGTKAAAKTAGNAGTKAAARAAGNVGTKTAARAAGSAGTKTAARAAGNAGTKAAARAAGNAGGKTAAKVAGNAAVKEAAKATGNAGARGAAEAIGNVGASTGGKAAGNAVSKSGAAAVGKAGVEAGAKISGSMLIGVSVIFIAWDAVDLGFTIRDLVENKGPDAAKVLRDKADELEASIDRDGVWSTAGLWTEP